MENVEQRSTTPKSPQNWKNRINSIFIVILIIVVSCIFGYIGGKHSGEMQQEKTTPTVIKATASVSQPIEPTIMCYGPQCVDLNNGSYTIATNIPNQMKFISPFLGISFEYTKYPNGDKTQPFNVKEVGNTVHVYSPYTDLLEIFVFKKDPTKDLATAIEKQILTGYSQKDCFVITKSDADTRPVHFGDLSSNFAQAVISYPGWDGSDVPNPNSDKCPAIYTENSGLAYFVMDPNHPDKFFFFDQGEVLISNFQVLQ